MTLCHATAVVCEGWAVLLTGAPGAGKSDLALRLIDRGWGLLADDQVRLCAEGGWVIAHAPVATRGLIEVRGVGIVTLEAIDHAPVALHVVLGAERERLPEAAVHRLLGIEVANLVLNPHPASAPIKLAHAFARALAALRAQPT